ncbi:recombinase RecA [Terriglobus roseus]|uniref:Protein RecA n=1 Tax=Terriglobus roseus TaxID=392734 RepID=A0A1G7H8Q2_9BACT|nr:recombinase RecA [Terriglobus roseus]SDE96817.1 recA DNA recombination protein [Terriglobus roseus]
MLSSNTIRIQVEAALAARIPSALTPTTRTIRPTNPIGITALDQLVGGGFPVGALTELVGEDCSGRSSVALSFLASITASGRVCAWIDASNTFHPASAASVGVDLGRLLWVRCGVQQRIEAQETKQFSLPSACFTPKAVTKGLHGGGHGTHPRSEAKGLSAAVDRFLGEEVIAARCAEPIARPRPIPQTFEPSLISATTAKRTHRRAHAYDAIEQALRSADLLIQTGGFSAIVLDLGSIAPEYAARIELSTWHRYRVAAEQTQSSILLLSQYPCAKSSSELQLRLHPMDDTDEEQTVFTGLNARVEVLRQRFTQTPSNVIPMRKPPQRATEARWQQRASWVGPR